MSASSPIARSLNLAPDPAFPESGMIAYMTAASLDRPYRGSGVDRPVGVPLPPDHLPLFRSGQLRKHWQYVCCWGRELSFCAARANVGLLRKEYWGIWDRASKRFGQRADLFPRGVQIEPHRVDARDGDAEIEVR